MEIFLCYINLTINQSINQSINLSLSLQFGLLETALTCLYDEVPKMRKYRVPLTICVGVALFFLALPCVCPVG
jgi:hypothetical protein